MLALPGRMPGHTGEPASLHAARPAPFQGRGNVVWPGHRPV